MECTDDFPGDFQRYLAKDIAAGKAKESDVDTAVSNILRVQFELGEFDADVAYRKTTAAGSVDTPAHQQLAMEAAEQSLVLLQNKPLNKGAVLPLKLPATGNLSVSVVGPYATLTQDLLGEADYSPENHRVDSHSVVQSLEAHSPRITVRHATGCTFKDNCNSSAGIAKAVQVAEKADVLVVAVGLVSCGVHGKTTMPSECESEGHDRYSIALPGSMPRLVEAAASATRNDVPIICVLVHGGQIAIEPLMDHCHAILDPHHPGMHSSFLHWKFKILSPKSFVLYTGQAGATAVVKAIFGALNPSGRLASTVYPVSFIKDDRPNMTGPPKPCPCQPATSSRLTLASTVQT